MTEREHKNKLQIPTRTARPKGNMFQNLRKPEQIESLTIEELVAVPGTSTDHPPTTHRPPTTQAIAPEKNFARVPNSIALSAIPSGIFRGESLKTWQALHQRTRAAIVPRRSVRATQAELMDWAGVSHNTLKAHLKHLSNVGLIKVHYRRGESNGAEYEVFTLEDRASTTDHPPTTHHPMTNQNVVGPTTQNLVLGGGGQTVDFPTTYENLKTSFKTNTEKIDDDEAFADLLTKLRGAAKEITGKETSVSERARWNELAELLITELKIAATRTTVSSVPAFLTEHLRRRLWKIDKKQSREVLPNDISEASSDKQPRNCPDCGGTGFYYPNGYENGVTKCKHDKAVNS